MNHSPLIHIFKLWAAISLVVVGCQVKKDHQIHEGDILFQHNACGPLCESIDKVTEGHEGIDYNHCGLVIRVNDTLRVVEAIGERVKLSSFKEFYQRSSQRSQSLLVGRLKPDWQSSIPQAVSNSLEQIGKPYDSVFEWGNEAIYCSELIYQAFETANQGKPLFDLAPMTFRDPETNEFFPPWVAYYQQLNYPIPEGKPGINPGSLSRSKKLDMFYVNLNY
jgi:Permuted papain-like amidase enzyme, YaeF/YiiX, C92 family